MPDRPALFWFRDDLRLADNPGLAAACHSGRPLVMVYVLDEISQGVRAMGAASKWWLDKSLRLLRDQIAARGGRLIFRRGAAQAELAKLAAEMNPAAVFWNRRYGAARKIDERIKTHLKSTGAEVSSFNANLLIEPFEMTTGSGDGYKVFTPFWRALQAKYQSPARIAEPTRLNSPPDMKSDDLDDWALHPSKPDWSASIARVWQPGEAGAHKRLDAFLNSSVGYASNRNRPDIEGTSRLSPHLHFGEIGPSQVWRAARTAEQAGKASAADTSKFLSELAWREFSQHLLYHDPEMSRLSWRRQFESVAWLDPDASDLEAWKFGQTGYPIVDAGMRQLWATGWMHNRVRMIVASMLTKDLLAHWRVGEEWFWDTLVDADEGNNASGWQWVAGSGADASPYFRVFNPVLQGEKFDPAGDYVRSWVPELSALPAQIIHRPWEAKADQLAAGGVELGVTYPKPIIDHAFARKRALDAYGVGVKGSALERPPE